MTGSGGPTTVEPPWAPVGAERLLGRRARLFTPWAQRVASWFLEAALVRDRTAEDPDVHAVLAGIDHEALRVWVLTLLHEQRIDPSAVTLRAVHVPADLIEPDLWASIEIATDSMEEPDPVFAALDELVEHQRMLQQAEADRVGAALAAWRAALAAEGAPTAGNTPYQRAFLTDLAFRMKIAATTARTLVTTASQLEGSLPAVWRYFQDGLTTWRTMQVVATHLDGLDPGFHAAFDAGALRKIVEVTPTGLPDALRRLRERLQASTADERHDEAAAKRHVVVEPVADGMAWLHAYLPAAHAIALDQQLTRAAVQARGRTGETRGVRQLKADVLIDGLGQALRKPRRAGRRLVAERTGIAPQVCITIPALTALGRSDVPATLEGYGTIGIRTASRLAGEAKAWVRVLTDPITGGVLDLARTRYRPSKDMRILLRMLDGGSRDPGAPRPPGQSEVDHVVPYHQDDARGPTSPANLALLSHRGHKDKTEHAIDYDLLTDRTALWRTATDATTIVTRPIDPLEPTPAPPPDLIDAEDCPF